MLNLKCSVLSLNVKGLRNSLKRQKIFYWLKQHNSLNAITFLQETHSDRKTEKSWKNYCNGDLYFSHGTTNSCGVLTLIGKNVDFILKNKIIDDSDRYVILLCEISGLTVLLLNTYAPNTESAQVTFFTELWEILSKLDNIDNIIWGGDFNCSFDKLDAVGGNFKPKRKSLYLIQEIMDCYDMCDIWRVRNESNRQYTWRQKSLLTTLLLSRRRTSS